METASIPQPPHGLMGLDTTTSDPLWLWLLLIGLGLLVIFAVVRWFLVRAKSNKGTLVVRSEEKIAAIRRDIETLEVSEETQGPFLSRLSIGLRGALEHIVKLPFTDMTRFEINNAIQRHWPLTNHLEAFKDVLEHSDRVNYQNHRLKIEELHSLKEQTLNILQDLESFVRYS
ncbi:hypothetical protein [Pseudobacteriovorax antillogorgiicola]|uniref:Uncharacterized protein n=1 Tax=Pseudobacteriovorax antillogorgiicola TaxID=1513793 RepID=A0A1Y6BVL0_9BACT|nr:hypothetical protein [Pseudobacteriovorax antillogorgiicola]TCS53909.1 hypothetical protein EDD56_107221 [Pseudobacteriovorax antillogorgiicola]SMF20689.1 hypothetical protein SAMN06296036_10751 [Pseudobacteriovorax antillogorgiicola]